MSVLSGSKLMDALMVFKKQFLEKVNFEKCQQMTTKAYQKLTLIYFHTLCVVTYAIGLVLKNLNSSLMWLNILYELSAGRQF